MIIFGHGSLTFKHLNSDGRLIVRSGRKYLRFFGRHDSVARNQFGHNSSHSFNTQSQRIHIQEQNIFSVSFPTENSSLNGGSIRDSLIWIDATARFFSVEEIFHKLLDFGNTGGSSDENNLIDIFLLQISIFENLFDRQQGGFEQIHVQFFKFGTSQSFREIFTINQCFNLDSGLMLS
eukprot:Sdes_comp22103_c0_seq1m20636